MKLPAQVVHRNFSNSQQHEGKERTRERTLERMLERTLERTFAEQTPFNFFLLIHSSVSTSMIAECKWFVAAYYGDLPSVNRRILSRCISVKLDWKQSRVEKCVGALREWGQYKAEEQKYRIQ